MPSTSSSADTGLEVNDILSDGAFAGRPSQHHDVAAQLDGMQRIARAFVESPDTILQELVNAAVELSGADSAGISIERPDRTDQQFYHWVATAGDYSGFLDAILPREPSACGICLERGRPQQFRVSQRFFDILGVVSPVVTDGILLPWQVEGTRGTIFIMAHTRTQAFTIEDVRMMEALANFAALGVRQQEQRRLLLEQTRAAAAAAMANELAHKINNPLQSLTNILFLAAESPAHENTRALAQHAAADLRRLSALVQQLLALPYHKP